MSISHTVAPGRLAFVLAALLASPIAVADSVAHRTAAGNEPVVPTLGAATVFENDEILATVNGRPIPAVSLDNVVRQLEEGKQPADRDTLLEELINMEVLAQAAEAGGLDRKPDVASALMLQYTQTLANAYLAEQNATLAVGDDELRAEYDRQVAALPEAEYRTAHILLETEEQAQSMIDALAAGESFKTLANENSIDSSGTDGGELGWLNPGSMLPEMAAAVTDMQVAQTSRTPVQSAFGWHVIHLEDTRRAALPDFEAVKPGLEGLLVRRTLAEKVAELRDAADVQIR